MKHLFSQLVSFRSGPDLATRTMRRIRREASLAFYQRSLYPVLGVSLVSSALTGYRLWQVVIDRSISGFYQTITHYLATGGAHPKILWDMSMTFREFFPLVEVGLFVLNVAGLAYLVKRALGVRREFAASPLSTKI